MYNFVTIADSKLDSDENVDYAATKLALEKGTRNKAVVRVIFKIKKALTENVKLRVPITSLNSIDEVMFYKAVKDGGEYLAAASLAKEPSIVPASDGNGFDIEFTAAGGIPVDTQLKFDVIGSN